MAKGPKKGPHRNVIVQNGLRGSLSIPERSHGTGLLFPETMFKLLKRFGGPDRDRTDDLFHAIIDRYC
jgi:hypothetical protein